MNFCTRKPKKTVLVDMDGVLVDFESGYRDAVTKILPEIELIPHHLRTSFYSNWQYTDKYPQYSKIFHKITKEPGYFRGLPVMSDAKKGIERLNKKYEVFICTSPMRAYQNCVLEKFQWVENNLGFDWTKKIILTRDKTLVRGTVLIDDKPDIDGSMEPIWEQVVFDQPYNSSIEGKFRLKSWREIDKLIEFIDSFQ